jgi:hypothetical protein
MYQMPSQIPDGDMSLINQLEAAAMLIRTRTGVLRWVSVIRFKNNQLSPMKIRTMEQVGIDSSAEKNFNLLMMVSRRFLPPMRPGRVDHAGSAGGYEHRNKS